MTLGYMTSMRIDYSSTKDTIVYLACLTILRVASNLFSKAKAHDIS